MASFATAVAVVPFTVDRDSYDESREARVAITEIPGSDDFYADRAGKKPLQLKFGVLVANATDWGAFMGLVGESGTLSIEGLDSHAAILMSLGRNIPFLDSQSKAQASFLVTDV
jgi:hypothetical protein